MNTKKFKRQKEAMLKRYEIRKENEKRQKENKA